MSLLCERKEDAVTFCRSELTKKTQFASLLELCDLQRRGGGVVTNDPPPTPVLSEQSESYVCYRLMKSGKSGYTYIAILGQ